jgi:hypothetical protein
MPREEELSPGARPQILQSILQDGRLWEGVAIGLGAADVKELRSKINLALVTRCPPFPSFFSVLSASFCIEL